ncbi:MAG: DUF3048 domain-containing protein [Clostridia bacterium]|nr:DUF3048 domain-containing protein [Clostridia bacterium]
MNSNKKFLSFDKMFKFIVVFIFLLAVIFMLFSFSTGTDIVQNIKDNNIIVQISSDISEKSDNESQYKTPPVNDLTGLGISEEYLSFRPVSVMIDNLEKTNPSYGLSRADIIYECPVEGMITRLMAVYKNPYDLPVIGNIRCTRPHFINLANGLDSIHIHIGADDSALTMLSDKIIDNFDLEYSHDMMWRDQNRMYNLGYEHSVLTSGQLLEQGVESSNCEKTYNKQIVTNKFSENSQVLNGTASNTINVKFFHANITSFNYDEAAQAYFVSHQSAQLEDANSGAKISRKNLLLLYVNATSSNGSYQVDLSGSGEGFYACNGKSIPIKWSRESSQTNFKFYDSDDNELELIPGQMYVCCVPNSGNIEIL